MYFLYDELQRATGAKLCCRAHFCNETDENIVVCSSDTMIVYQVVHYKEGASTESENETTAYKLRLIAEYPLSGEVLCITPIPMSIVFPTTDSSKRDALIMSFKGNYMSIVSYDSYDSSIQTVERYDLNREAVIGKNSSVLIMGCDFRKRRVRRIWRQWLCSEPRVNSSRPFLSVL